MDRKSIVRSIPTNSGRGGICGDALGALGVSLLLGLYACGAADQGGEERVGEQGKVKFTGGGGCNGSTTLAAGSKAALTLEPMAGGTLPASLAVSSSDPKVIKASAAGSKGDRVVLEAAGAAGSAHVELRAGGALWDRLHNMGQKLYYTDCTSADVFFQKFVYENPNIFMVHCGHVDAELRQVSKNKAGRPVHEILVDFQELSPKGGDGWMRLLTFNLTRGKIKVRTYSPTLGQYRKNGAGLSTSIQAMKMALTSYSAFLKSLGLDLQQLQKQLDAWTNTAAGRAELAKLLYEDGRRDSEFTLDVAFSSYRV